MIAIELISEEIPPLKHTDSGDTALQWMEEFKVTHLPVLKNENFVGLVSETDIFDKGYPEKTLHELFVHLPRPYVKGNAHIYEVLHRVSLEHISIVPVLDDEENYLGCISQEKLVQKIAETGSIRENGGIIILEMNSIDYSLAQIAQIVEGESAKILSCFISSTPDSTKIEVTLKINQMELSRIIRSFERYDINVKASFQKSSHEDDLKNRYDELMKYLNI
jgi:predicted transcriptional regulator